MREIVEQVNRTLYECETCKNISTNHIGFFKCSICGKEICEKCRKPIHLVKEDQIIALCNKRPIESTNSVCQSCYEIALKYQNEYSEKIDKIKDEFFEQIKDANKVYKERIENERRSE